jgi:hypothetical protein
MNLQMCTAGVVCPDVANAFKACLDKDIVDSSSSSRSSNTVTLEEMEHMFNKVQKCNDNFELSARALMTREKLYK